jgi:hypothetical protein
MDLVFLHGVEYDVTAPVAVQDLIKSLEANAKLLDRSTTLLEELFPGIKFESATISVRNLSQGSPLKELFALAVVLAYQKGLEEEVPALFETITGIHVSDQYDTLLTVLVLLIAVYGIDKAYEAAFPGRDKKAISDTQESLLQKAANLTGVTVVRIREAVNVLFTGRQHRATVLASQKMFAPTRGQPQVTIRVPDGDILVPAEAVAIAQSASGFPYEPPEVDEKPKQDSHFHRNVKIILHAMDRDKKKSGWAGHVPGLFDDRIPMDLEKSQSPDILFGKSEVIGDILLMTEEDENGEMKPKNFLLVQSYLD